MPELHSQRRDINAFADRIGVFGALLCALHCALLPLALAAAPAVGLGLFASADFDQMMAVFAGLLGAASLGLGFRRHRAFGAWALLLPGLALLGFGAFTGLHDHSGLHASVMTLGGLLVAAAHLLNLRLAHRRPMVALQAESA